MREICNHNKLEKGTKACCTGSNTLVRVRP
jgi:hypothetical protein